MLLISRRRRNQRRQWVRELLRSREEFGEFHHLVKDMRRLDGEDFFQYFRMTRQRFDLLLSLVGPYLQRQTTFWRRPISAEQRLSFTIRYLAHGSSMRLCAVNYRLGRSTASMVIRETCKAIRLALEHLYLTPPSTSQWEAVAEDFEALWDFPNCIGALDGKHVTVQAPPNAGSEFFNYKGTHSIVLLATCDARYRFTLVDIGEPGRHSDGGIFRSSVMGENLISEKLGVPAPRELPGTRLCLPYVLVADEAFPLLRNLMRPFPRKDLDLARRIFNYRLSRCRRLIENVFGILVARWRIFRQPIQASVETVTAIVWAAVCLHNFLTTSDLGDRDRAERRYCPAGFADREEQLGGIIPGQWRQEAGANTAVVGLSQAGSNNHSESAKAVRQWYARYFCSKKGEVHWQYAVVYRGAVPH